MLFAQRGPHGLLPSPHAQDLKPGNYKMENFCMEPTSFTVKEESSFKGGESEFVSTKLMTRLTYTLDDVSLDARVIRSGAPVQKGMGLAIILPASGHDFERLVLQLWCPECVVRGQHAIAACINAFRPLPPSDVG